MSSSVRGRNGCVCTYEYRASLGRLYGVDMMGGWVRLRDLPECPHTRERRHGRSSGPGRDEVPGDDGEQGEGEHLASPAREVVPSVTSHGE